MRLGFLGRPFFGPTRVPAPRYRSCGTPNTPESTTRPMWGSIHAYRPRPKWCLGELAHAAWGAGETRIRAGCPHQAAGVGRVGAQLTRNGRCVRPGAVMPVRWCTRGACAMPGRGAAGGGPMQRPELAGACTIRASDRPEPAEGTDRRRRTASPGRMSRRFGPGGCLFVCWAQGAHLGTWAASQGELPWADWQYRPFA